MPEIESIRPPSLQQLILAGESLTLLDVREPDERAFCAIPVPSDVTDIHIPIREIPTRLDEISDAARGRTLVVYCHHGVRSMMAGTWLEGQGIRPVLNLDGGIDAWSSEVDRSVPKY